IVIQLIEQERDARNNLLEKSRLKLTERIYRSFGILKHSRVIELKEASVLISDVKLGVDLGIIEGLSHSILNELIILTQQGFVQHYVNKLLSVEDRDELRAELIRKRLQIKLGGCLYDVWKVYRKSSKCIKVISRRGVTFKT